MKNSFKIDREKGVFLLLSLLFLTYFIVKALIIPITHDESSSCIVYSPLPVKEILNYDNPWPTNHILNTLAVKLTTFLFGLNQFTGRLPNLITAIFFLFFAYKISRLITTSFLISITIFLLFLCNPYMNDFFSLARGYGMAVAFMTASFYALLLFLKDISYKNIILIMTFGFITVAANFSCLIYITSLNAIVFLVCLYAFSKKKIDKGFFVKSVSLLFIFDLAVAIFSYYPITRMNATNQFRFWGSNGFYNETFLSLFNTFMFDIKYFENENDFLPKLILGIIILLIVSGILMLIRNKFENNFLKKIFISSCLLLLITVGINIAQHKSLGTPYLWGRTALLYVPLTALMAGSGLALLHYYFNRAGIIASWILITIISIHLIASFNFKFFKEWQFDQNTFDVLGQMKKIRETRKTGEQIKLNAHWLFYPSLNFYKNTQNLSWLDLVPAHKEPQFEKHDEFYYTLSDEYNIVPSIYKKILVLDNDARALFQLSNNHEELSSASGLSPAVDSRLYFSNNVESSFAWNENHATNIIRSDDAHSGNYVCKIDSSNPYSVGFDMKLSDISSKPLKLVHISAWVQLSSMSSNPTLSVDIRDHSKKTLEWIGKPAKKTMTLSNKWGQVILDLNLDEKSRNNPENHLRVYVMNKEAAFSLVDDVELLFEEK